MMHPLRRLSTGLGLALLGLGANAHGQQSAADARQELQSIEKALQDENKAMREAAKAAADEAAAEAVYSDYLENVLPEFAARYAAVARANKGSEVALEAWTKLIGLGARGLTSPLTSEALAAITSDHLNAPGLASLAGSLRYAAPAVDEKAVLSALKALAGGSPHREVQAAALYSLGAVLGEGRADDDPRVAEAKLVLGKLSAFGDVKFRDGRSYAEAGQAFLFALENLVVGKPCPDFTAVDAEGAAFKLSDYKGKVVLVDFWGFW